MININNKKCLECNKIPIFNFARLSNGIYCFDHKKSGMVNIKNKICLECDKYPSFNFSRGMRAIYCITHKKPGIDQ